jgi:hypothetical protein
MLNHTHDIQTLEDTNFDIKSCKLLHLLITFEWFFFQPNASVSANNEGSASSHKTPAKRSAAKNVQLDTIGMEVQLSSTRNRKLIKKEKI